MEKIKVCLVGLNFGSWMIENELIGNTWAELTAICDMNRKKADEWAEKLGCAVYYDIDEMLKNKEIGAVVLITGPVGRADLIEKILDAGKDVMTTKPFERSAKKALAVLEKAERLGRVVHMNSPSVLPGKDMQIIYGWREKFGLGRPIAVRASVWCSYREKADGSWYDEEELCPMAPVYRLGIYLLNDIIPLFGQVEEMHVLQSRIFTGRPTPDNAQLSMRFENGALGNVFASFCVNDGQHYRNSLELNFENGTVYRNVGAFPKTDGEPVRLSLSAMTEDGQRIVKEEVSDRGSGYQWENFYRAVNGERLEGAVTKEKIAEVIKIFKGI